MKIICAWCKKEIGEKEPIHNTAISHGICEECDQKMRKELKGFINNLKDSLRSKRR